MLKRKDGTCSAPVETQALVGSRRKSYYVILASEGFLALFRLLYTIPPAVSTTILIILFS